MWIETFETEPLVCSACILFSSVARSTTLRFIVLKQFLAFLLLVFSYVAIKDNFHFCQRQILFFWWRISAKFIVMIECWCWATPHTHTHTSQSRFFPLPKTYVVCYYFQLKSRMNFLDVTICEWHSTLTGHSSKTSTHTHTHKIVRCRTRNGVDVKITSGNYWKFGGATCGVLRIERTIAAESTYYKIL